jgi:hypothetical protein
MAAKFMPQTKTTSINNPRSRGAMVMVGEDWGMVRVGVLWMRGQILCAVLRFFPRLSPQLPFLTGGKERGSEQPHLVFSLRLRH